MPFEAFIERQPAELSTIYTEAWCFLGPEDDQLTLGARLNKMAGRSGLSLNLAPIRQGRLASGLDERATWRLSGLIGKLSPRQRPCTAVLCERQAWSRLRREVPERRRLIVTTPKAMRNRIVRRSARLVATDVLLVTSSPAPKAQARVLTRSDEATEALTRSLALLRVNGVCDAAITRCWMPADSSVFASPRDAVEPASVASALSDCERQAASASRQLAADLTSATDGMPRLRHDELFVRTWRDATDQASPGQAGMVATDEWAAFIALARADREAIYVGD
ncbi:hypothetical protein [Parvularcula oceani]|uniref:hypothetical protein n=1 Tax=Parvularcula oceani TaxID=1247963 RepID=UPI0004E2513F|nr:hypothetical protein [Parvularcula oceani]